MTKVIPLHKKSALLNPKNYRMLAINGSIYRLYANVVRDLLTEWAIARRKSLIHNLVFSQHETLTSHFS